MKKHLLLIALAFMSLTAAVATPSVLRQNIMRMMEQTGLKGNAESQAELMEQILPALAQRLSTPAPPVALRFGGHFAIHHFCAAGVAAV